MDSNEIIKYISESPKQTPVRVYIKGELSKIDFSRYRYFGNENFGILFCELKEFEFIINHNSQYISDHLVEVNRKNSAVPLADFTKFNARIEPGAIIRDMVEIGDNCVIMMGVVINIGAVIGEKTMIDMNAVIGGRVVIGKNCHIGAGAVLAGVIEPPSAEPVVIGDNTLIGANAVVLEGIKVGHGSVIAAGSVVISDVEPLSVMAGVPAKLIKKVDEKTKLKTTIIDALRKL
jgi:2,3,4,5-tetrahydropyridine-2,6-dicarboxylate N-acetyltransferase